MERPLPRPFGPPTLRRSAPERQPARPRRGPLKWLVVSAWLVFISSIPFEAGLLFGGEGLFSISRLLGYGFFALALLQPRMCFRKPPRALWWFSAYLLLYCVAGIYQPAPYQRDIFSTAFRMGQFYALFWVGSNLMQDGEVARWSLLGFAASCVAVAGLLAGGIGVSEYAHVAGRNTVFGQGPNALASIVGLGAVILIGTAYGKAHARPRTKMLCWFGFLVIAAAITRTGSRGALVGVAAGVMTLLAAKGSAKTRMRNALIVILALGACVAITVTSITTASRWNKTIEEGSLAGREGIFRSSLQMFFDRPILGWGPVTNIYVLGQRRGTEKRDMHNMFLWIMTELGLVGSTLFGLGLYLCFRGAWRARRGPRGMLPLALLAASLTFNLSSTYHVTKWFWFVLAYTVASGLSVSRRTALPFVPIRPGAAGTPRGRTVLSGRLAPRGSAGRARLSSA